MLGSSSLAHLHSSTRIARSPFIRKKYNGSLINIHETQHKLDKINQDQPLRVCVRKRPRSKKELSQRERDGVSVMDDNCTVLINESKKRPDSSHFTERYMFTFDDVLNTDHVNSYVYERTAQPLVSYIFEKSGNATCFAYGQRNSGKTHTLFNGHDGISVMAAREILNMLQKPEYMHLSAWVGFYEIHQNQLYDLLDDRKKLYTREIKDHPMAIVGLKEFRIKSVSDMTQMVSCGNQLRMKDPLYSHAVLQITLRQTDDKKVIMGKLRVMEIAEGTLDKDERTRTDVELRSRPVKTKKVIRLLNESFMNESRACMIATVLSTPSNVERTLNTLRCANEIKNQKESRAISHEKMTEFLRQHKQHIYDMNECLNKEFKFLHQPHAKRSVNEFIEYLEALNDLLELKERSIQQLKKRIDEIKK
ncbi:hypothetical protein RMCBS344292_18823 [Rhizopus microsporus]|nr:hypothetical protein RMCBS344292_18823 [Rhizopus microsporus]